MLRPDQKEMVEFLKEALGCGIIDPEEYHDLTKLAGERFADRDQGFCFGEWTRATKGKD